MKDASTLNLEPLPKSENIRSRGSFVALDAYKRLHLSADLRRKLGLARGEMAQVYIFVDRANKYIAFSRPDPVTLVKGGNLFTVSKRGYVYAPAIFDSLGMPVSRAVFEYDGTADLHGVTWQLCRLVETE